MAVSASEHWPMGVGSGPVVTDSGLVAEIHDNFAGAAKIWSDLAQNAHATAYQSFGLMEGYFRNVDAVAGAKAALIVIRDAAARPMLLLPLAVHRRGPLRIAQFIGGKQVNFHMAICADASANISADALKAALVAAGRRAKIDVFAFSNQPQAWQGFTNPLAKLGGDPSPSQGYKFSLQGCSETTLKHQQSKDTRRKLRQKSQKLAAIGPLSYRKPVSAEASDALEAFFALKAERFGAQGITDPFAAEPIRAFLREAVMAQGSLPAQIELHTLHVGDRMVALFGAVANSERFSALFTAFDNTPEIARCSPGDILLTEMIRDCCQRGLATFDLGVGEATYKDKICDQVEPLFDSFIAATPTGALAAIALTGAQRLKRTLKTSETGQRLIQMMRQIKAKRVS